MTAQFSPVDSFASTLGDICSRTLRIMVKYTQTKATRVRLAHLNSVLSALDPHILKDIGLEGYERLTSNQKVQVLLSRRRPG